MVGSMRSQHRLPPRPSRVWLTAGALLLPAAIWAATSSFDPGATPTPALTVTPSLPPGSATVVGIGDSVTSAAVCECIGFVESYAANLPAAAGGPAHAVNLGAGGLTAVGLRALITSPSPTATGVAQGDFLLVTIGANDLKPLLARWQASGCTSACYSPAVQEVGSDLAAILVAAKDLRGHQPTRILVTDYWNVFADGDVARAGNGPAYLRWSDELTRALNGTICAVARDAGAICVDLYAPFKGDGSLNPTTLLEGDGDHPNAGGNNLIAATLMAATPMGDRQHLTGTG